jgi:uncharacterized RDD family membrane protein YckC
VPDAYPPAMTILVLVLVAAAIWVWSLVDAVRIPDQRWDAAGENKVLWVILIVVLGLLGSLLYVLMPRKKLGRPTSESLA